MLITFWANATHTQNPPQESLLTFVLEGLK